MEFLALRDGQGFIIGHPHLNVAPTKQRPQRSRFVLFCVVEKVVRAKLCGDLSALNAPFGSGSGSRLRQRRQRTEVEALLFALLSRNKLTYLLTYITFQYFSMSL